MFKDISNILFFGSISIICFISCQVVEVEKTSWNYPSIDKSIVREEHWGKTIVDPYRNLERLDQPKIKEWVDKQNQLYHEVIKKIPNIDSLEQELKFHNSFSAIRVDVPRPAGNRVFYKQRFLEDNLQKVFYKDGLDANAIEIFSTGSFQFKDLNIDYFEPSFDGKFLALGVSHGGDEMSTIMVLDVERKTLLKDSIGR